MKTMTINEIKLVAAIFGRDKLRPDEKKRLEKWEQENPVCTPDKCVNEKQ